MEANESKGCIRSQEKLMMAQLKVGYLPHFSVVREDKETTKGRIVFD